MTENRPDSRSVVRSELRDSRSQSRGVQDSIPIMKIKICVICLMAKGAGDLENSATSYISVE